MVGLGGLEPPTSPLSGARSSHLSYRPFQNRVAIAYNLFSLRCLSVIRNCVQIRALCTRQQLLCQSTLFFVLEVGVNAGDFQAGMANLRSHEVTRQSCGLHLTDSPVPECVHGAHWDAQTFADGFQKSSGNVLAQQWPATTRFKHPPGLAATDVGAKHLDGFGIQINNPFSGLRLRWPFDAVPDRARYFDYSVF